MSKYTLNFIVILLYWGLSLNAQINNDILFDQINSSDGLTVNTVRSIAKDKDGNIWLASEKGLVKYNGYNSKIFSNTKDSSGILALQVSKIFIDSKNFIWIAYRGDYISRFDPVTEKFTHYYPNLKNKTSYPGGSFANIIEDKTGGLWMALWGGGLSYFNPNTETFKSWQPSYMANDSLSSINVSYIARRKDGVFYVGTWEGNNFNNTLQTFNPKTNKFSRFNFDEFKFESPQEKHNITEALKIVNVIYLDNDENLWVGTFVGLVFIDLANKTMYRLTGQLNKPTKEYGFGKYEKPVCITPLNDHKLWVGNEVGGIMEVDLKTKNCTYITHVLNYERSITSNRIRSFFVDEFGNIWVGTDGGSISIYSPILQQFKFITNEQLNAQKFNKAQGQTAIHFISESKDGKTIYFSHGNGFTIYKTDKEEFTWINTEKEMLGIEIDEKISPNNPLNVGWVLDQEKNILVKAGESDNVLEYEKVNGRNIKSKVYRNVDAIKYSNDLKYAAAIKRNNKNDNLLFFTINAKKNSIRDSIEIPAGKGKYNNIENPILFQLDSANWVFSQNRLIFHIINISKKKYKTYGNTLAITNLPDSVYFFFTVDYRSNIWFTGRQKNLIKFEYKTGKFEFIGNSLGLGKEDIIYSITEDNNNILWIALKSELIRFDPKNKSSVRFGSELGLKDVYFSEVKSSHQNSEDVFIATSYGALAFNPQKLIFKQTPSKVNISNIIVNNDTLSPQKIAQFYNGNYSLKPNQNSLLFEFSSSQVYTSGIKNYYYRLIGLDTIWRVLLNNNIMKFTNLSAGDYRFEVYCSNNYGYSSSVLKLNFQIPKVLWLRWWFIILEILFSLSLIYIFVKYRELRLKKQLEIIVATQERERNLISKNLHDSIGHSLIVLKSQPNKKELIDNIITDVRSLSLNLYPVIIEKIGLQGAIIDLVESSFINSGIKYSYSIDENVSNIQKDISINIYRIIQEQVTNILKHSSATRVSVYFEVKDLAYSLKVIDNGVGFDFDLAMSKKSLGLNSIKDRVTMLNKGRLSVTSSSEGTTCVIEFKG